MNAQEKLNRINEMIAQGCDVYFCTAYKSIKVNAKTVAKFANVGCDLFRVSGNSLFIAAGKRFDCVDGCAIRVVK